jgi:hypothetical protein
MPRIIPVVALLVAVTGCNFRDVPTGATTVTQTTTVTTTYPPPVAPTPTPAPGGGGTNPPGSSTRTPDPASGGTLPLPTYGQTVLQQYAASSAGAAALVNACPTGGTSSWAFMDGLVDQLRQRDTRWGYLCRRGNCFDPSNDVVAYHATAGPEITGTAGVIGVDVIGDLCGGNTAQWLPAAFDPAALWTSRGRF